jgi:hypothetical protein
MRELKKLTAQSIVSILGEIAYPGRRSETIEGDEAAGCAARDEKWGKRQ